MRRIDITRELLSAPPYPGDPEPRLEAASRVEWGDACNTSVLHTCLHTGTHLDVPRHYLPDEADAEQALLESCIGACTVVAFDGLLLGAQAEALLKRVRRRLLFKGRTEISPSAAFVLSDAGFRLVGVEGVSISPSECEAAVHRQLLGSGMVILEGLDLSAVEPGGYFLFAAPLKIRGADGSPVRAVLMEESGGL